MMGTDVREAVPDLDAILDIGIDYAKSRFAENHEVRPMWIAETNDNTLMMVPGLIEDKDEQIAALRAIFKAKHVVRYVMIQEAWMVELRPDNVASIAAAKLMAPSKHPDRREVLIVHAESKTECTSATYYILRPERGTPTLSPPKFAPRSTFSEGRMFELLRDPSPSKRKDH